MCQSRPLFVYFCPFIITISIIQIEKSVNGVLGIWTRSHMMVGSDDTMELWRQPSLTVKASRKFVSTVVRGLEGRISFRSKLTPEMSLSSWRILPFTNLQMSWIKMLNHCLQQDSSFSSFKHPCLMHYYIHSVIKTLQQSSIGRPCSPGLLVVTGRDLWSQS